MEKYYYLVNGTVKVSDSKMPEISKSSTLSMNNIYYDNWLSSLQPCEISESELCLIFSNVSKLDYDNPIDITDIVEEKDGKIYFKQLQAKIDELTAQFEQSDKMYCELLAKKDDFKRMFSEAMEQNQQLQAKIDELEKENENLLLNIKSLSHK